MRIPFWGQIRLATEFLQLFIGLNIEMYERKYINSGKLLSCL